MFQSGRVGLITSSFLGKNLRNPNIILFNWLFNFNFLKFDKTKNLKQKQARRALYVSVGN